MSEMLANKSRLGLWLEENKVDRYLVHQRSRLSNERIKKLLEDPHYHPDGNTMRIILSILKEKDSSVKLSDFWNV